MQYVSQPDYPTGPPLHHNVLSQQAPPPHYQPPPQHGYPLQNAVPPQHAPPPSHAPPHQYVTPPQQGPPPRGHSPPPRMIMTIQNQHPPRVEGPPYPVDDNIPLKQTVGQEIQRPPVPVIQIENDQYRPPQQQYAHYTPPPQVYSAPPQQYPYQEQVPQMVPQQQPYYTSTDTSIQRTVPNIEPARADTFRKTIVNETADYSTPLVDVSAVKRKSPGGPLRLSSTNTHPVLSRPDVREGSSRGSASRSTKPVAQLSEEPVIKKAKSETGDEGEVISPLQGYKILITNLHVTVTQDDVIELFGAIGAVKKVRLIKPGTAEVSYVKKEDAMEATKTYHERELDGQPMAVKMVTSMSARVKQVPEKLPPNTKPLATAPLKLNKKPAGMAKVSEKQGVELGVLHKALFKTGSNSSSKPVTFTVNI